MGGVMISRRSLLAALGALGASCALPKPAKAASGTIMGAIRWDPWYGSTYEVYGEASLGPAPWQFRSPWFGSSTGANTIKINGNSQANLDLELQAAHAAGIQYWAYDWYGDVNGAACTSANAGCVTYSGFENAWGLHQSSSYASYVKWCVIYQMQATPSGMTVQMAQMAAYMAKSNYLTVLGGRPVFYWLASTSVDSSWAPCITALRAACSSLGLGNPYVVVMLGQTSAASVITIVQAVGADAISNYSYFTSGPFAGVTSALQSQWAAFAAAASAASLGYVPNLSMGSDRRPRFEANGNPAWVLNSYFCPPATNTERVTQVQDAITFILANPSVCASTLGVIYAWTECDEGGGCLAPTIGDPPSATPPYMNGIETALSAILP